MADISVTRKSGGQQHTWIWILAAVIAVAALIGWLVIQSEAVRETAVIQETEPTETGGATEAAVTGEAAEIAAIAAAPDTFMNRPLQVADVDVAATLGDRAFWADVPGQNPFLVVLSPDIAQPSLSSGQTVDIQGTVAEVDEAVLDEWVESGAIREGARAEAGFATHYILADRVTMTTPEAG